MSESVKFSLFLEDLASAGMARFERNGQRAFSNLDKLVGRSQRGLGGLGNAFSFNQITSAFSTLKEVVSAVITPVFEATAEFQKQDAVLTNLFSSARASGEAMGMIRDFAAKTPYQVNELTDSFVKLAGRGIVATKEELTGLGDFAAASGKDFGQLTEAVLDASNPVRWKEFGVAVSRSNGMATVSFRGMTKTVEDNDRAVFKLINEWGHAKGISGTMESISKTLGGQWSNLKDNVDSLLISTGELFNGGFGGGISILNQVVDAAKKFVGFIQSNMSNLSQMFAPVRDAFQPLIDSFRTAGDMLGLTGDKGKFLETVLNTIGSIWQYTAPIAKEFFAAIGTGVEAIVKIVKAIVDFIKRNEWLQKSLFGLWNAALEVFRGIAKAAKNLLGGVGDLIAGIFNGNLDQIGEGLKQLKEAVTGTFTLGEQAGKGFIDGYKKGFQYKDFFAGPKDIVPERQGESLSDVRKRMATQQKGAAAGDGNSSLKAGIAGVQGDAKAARNLTVNIHNLIESLVFKTENMTESKERIKQIVTDALLSAVRDVEYIGG